MSPIKGLHKKKKNSKLSKLRDINKLEDCNIPREIDTHYQLYGKHVWETGKLAVCNICNGGIDENGLCACGSGED
ncbi:MAG: hypothetical protein ACE5SW_00920 [Nitrososphaeraceae archaeon]